MEQLKKIFDNNAVIIRGYYVGILLVKNAEVIDFSQGKITLISNETIQLYDWKGLKKGHFNEIPNLGNLAGTFFINNHPTIIAEGFQYTVISDSLYNHIKNNLSNN